MFVKLSFKICHSLKERSKVIVRVEIIWDSFRDTHGHRNSAV